jgi:hypothetical protein
MFARSSIMGKDKTPVVYPSVPSQIGYGITFSSVGQTAMSITHTRSGSGGNVPEGTLVVVYHSRSGSTNITPTDPGFYIDPYLHGPVNGKEYFQFSSVALPVTYGSSQTVRGLIYGDKPIYVINTINQNTPTASVEFRLTGLTRINRYCFFCYSYTGSGESRIYNFSHILTPGNNYGLRATSA